MREADTGIPGADALLDLTVTVFCQNEAARIGACVTSIARAADGLRAGLTVIANGSSDGSADLALHAARTTGLPARVYSIAFGDKANAINQAMHVLLQPARLHVFADGYTTISSHALTGLARVLADRPHARAATGVAGSGRTMVNSTLATLQQGGRLHGQLHALRSDFVSRMVARGLRLPIGLYRGDGLLGSMVCHDLDAVGEPWDGHRIAGTSEATYMIPKLSPFRRSDVARHFRRKIRQMRGNMENAAIKSVIYAQGYAALPEHADDMIAAWLAAGNVPRSSLADRPFLALAMRQHARAARPAAGLLAPRLVGTAPGAT